MDTAGCLRKSGRGQDEMRRRLSFGEREIVYRGPRGVGTPRNRGRHSYSRFTRTKGGGGVPTGYVQRIDEYKVPSNEEYNR
jgi:hypothetical protein